jgi:DNA-binding transcriptional LysR family regulator
MAAEASDRRLADRLHTTVAAVPGAVRYLLPLICAELATAEPPLSVEVTTVPTLDACNLVRESEADLALVDGPTDPLSLQSEIVGQRHLLLVVGRRHRWAKRRKSVPVEQLVAARLVLPLRGTGTRDVIETELRRRGHPLPPMGLLDAGSADVQRAMVTISNELATIIDRREVITDLDEGRLVEVRTDVQFEQPFRLAWSGRAPRSEGAQQFAAAARKLAASRAAMTGPAASSVDS